MSPLTTQQVLDAAAAMQWTPKGTIELLTDDYRLVRYPEWMVCRTFPAAHVTWSRTARPLDEVIVEVAERVRGWALPRVAWWVSAASQPPDTEETLRAYGAALINETRVLARGLGEPDIGAPVGVDVELVRDERTFRAASDLTVRGWRRTEPDQAEFARQLAEALGELERQSVFRVVAYVNGQPVSTGGCTLAADAGPAGQVSQVAQLWGAFTLPAFRGRGCYRAVLAEQLRLARQHGVGLALVKGRVLTLAPILLRSGFADYGGERCYWLPVG